jgi:excisionase family DNA binding protein
MSEKQVYYTPGVVAAWSGVTAMSVIRWCEQGLIPAIKTAGGHRRIPAQAVRAFLEQRGMPVPVELTQAPKPDERKRGAKGQSKKGPVLILESDISREEQWQAKLAKFGKTLVFTDAYRALAAASANPPSLVVLDVCSEEAEHLLKALRGEKRTANVRVLAWGADRDLLEAAKELGADEACADADGTEFQRIVKSFFELVFNDIPTLTISS